MRPIRAIRSAYLAPPAGTEMPSPNGTPTVAMSGTSVSAGVVSGVAALMLEANPSLRQGHVKLALQLSAQFLREGVPVGCRCVPAVANCPVGATS